MAKRQCGGVGSQVVGTPKWLLTATVDQALQSSLSVPEELVRLVADYVFDDQAISPQQQVLVRDGNGFWRRATLLKLVYGRATVTFEGQTMGSCDVDVFTDVRHLADLDVVVSTWTGNTSLAHEVLLYRLPDVDDRGISFNIGRGCPWTHPTTYRLGHLPLLQLVKEDDDKRQQNYQQTALCIRLLFTFDSAHSGAQLRSLTGLHIGDLQSGAGGGGNVNVKHVLLSVPRAWCGSPSAIIAPETSHNVVLVKLLVQRFHVARTSQEEEYLRSPDARSLDRHDWAYTKRLLYTSSMRWCGCQFASDLFNLQTLATYVRKSIVAANHSKHSPRLTSSASTGDAEQSYEELRWNDTVKPTTSVQERKIEWSSVTGLNTSDFVEDNLDAPSACFLEEPMWEGGAGSSQRRLTFVDKADSTATWGPWRQRRVCSLILYVPLCVEMPGATRAWTISRQLLHAQAAYDVHRADEEIVKRQFSIGHA